MLIDNGAKEISIKLVIFGPTNAGKTTMIKSLFEILDREVTYVEGSENQTIFFDYGVITKELDEGWTIKINIWTNAGRDTYKQTLPTVLNSADGILFQMATPREDYFLHNLDYWNFLVKSWMGFVVIVVPEKKQSNYSLESMKEKISGKEPVQMIKINIDDGKQITFLVSLMTDIIVKNQFNSDEIETINNELWKHLIFDNLEKYNVSEVLRAIQSNLETITYPGSTILLKSSLNLVGANYSYEELHNLGIMSIVGLEKEIIETLNEIDESKINEQYKQDFIEAFIHRLRYRIRSGLPTHNFDIDTMKESPYSVLVPDIIENRQKEVESIKLPVSSTHIDLRPLWATAYGYRILNEMNMKLNADINLLSEILDAFKKIGIEISTTDQKYQIPESTDTRFLEYIFQMIDT